ncbi:radical SAM family heme chaperone HemW [Cellulomonas denverensis]|uniref:Heme chaperone HemW n=1 Tax=Cellulomonas denverensis TaxID=264297 RepID=A0A7X6QZW4_9CELL|nr:radical SAM family heme chaperone HemW [Cellulomonas denverensis]NKY23679.1 coproporphyrinogen III oxidase [Cellulomonas denverensis]GIG26978.1 coproporphyrinogen III oxidase [Cellulomonas denverensis]
MAPALPEGDPAPRDGRLPETVREGAGDRGFGVYLHVPFCTVRCGYCDFNTYTATELGGGASQSSYADTALTELALARRVVADAGLPERPVRTVFVGGGTPTVLPARDLARMLTGVRDAWGLAADAEVTTEANPDSVTPQSLAELAAAGFTRVSFGMQSAVPRVLATLDRTHDPRRIPDVVRWAREAGLAVSLDLIYGTPGESLDDWRASVESALATGVDHISAYALVIEPGTRMAVQVRRGDLPLPEEDDQAAKYELADDLFTAAGLTWYEVSNWARTPQDACRHNLAYWRGDDWWGIGPGAHSHLGGVRWWNVKHPRAYADRLADGSSPAAGRELIAPDSAQLERVMLGVRLREGLPLSALSPAARTRVAALVADGLVDPMAALGRGVDQQRVVLTRRGRLLADAVVRDLTD